MNVYSDVSGGVIEDATLSFTLLTSPITTDSDGDGLNDSEELSYGLDAWRTDPLNADTDGDGWDDGYESITSGTNPLSEDTDGDSADDPHDIDPLRNLLVKVRVKKIHNDGAWCTPVLTGVVYVNDDYIYVTENVGATEDEFISLVCWPPLIPTTQYKTAVVNGDYYADVPDDASYVQFRAEAYSDVWSAWDEAIAEATWEHPLGTSTDYEVSNGGHWMTLTVSTVALDKVHTLAITDGNVTAQAENGQHRYVAQDRYFVFLVEATSDYGGIDEGMHAIIVPRSIYVESKLRANLDAGETYPLSSTEFFGEDESEAEVSEAVAAVTAGKLSGYRTNRLLEYLLQNSTGDEVHEAVDVTSYVPLLNLPGDALQIIPWQGVTNSLTGDMPQGFWDWLGDLGNTIVNGLIAVGQLIYGGLIAIGNFFVALGEAIVEWGMWLIGTYQEALQQVKQAIEKVGEVLGAFVEWIVQKVVEIVQGVLDPIIQLIVQLIEETIHRIVQVFETLSILTTPEGLVTLLGSAILGSQLFFSLLLIAVGISVAEKVTMVASGGGGAILMNTLIPLVRNLIIGAVVGLVIIQTLNTVLPTEDELTSLVPSQFSTAARVSFGFTSFFQKLGLYVAAQQRGWASLAPVEKAFQYAMISFVILLMRTAVDTHFKENVTAKASLVFLDAYAIYLTFFVAKVDLGKARGPLSRFYPLMFPVTEALNLVAMVSAAAYLIGDVASLGEVSGLW